VWEIIGWVGSVLVVVSLMQARVLRFRALNLTGSVIATIVNAVLGVWSFAAMNAAIAVIDVFWLSRLLRGRHDAAVYQVIEVAAQDGYLRHVLTVHGADIARFYPSFRVDGAEQSRERSAFLVLRGDETVGVVVVRDDGDGVGVVELDYVTQRFRDFTPGEFVYRRSGVFQDKHLRRLVVTPDAHGSRDYFARVGFRSVAGGWERDVESAAA
jgi:hypothetical protein